MNKSFPESSLVQTRNGRIKEAFEAVLNSTSPDSGDHRGGHDVLVTTVEEDEKSKAEDRFRTEAAIESAVNIILAVKKVKRDLHKP